MFKDQGWKPRNRHWVFVQKHVVFRAEVPPLLRCYTWVRRFIVLHRGRAVRPPFFFFATRGGIFFGPILCRDTAELTYERALLKDLNALFFVSFLPLIHVYGSNFSFYGKAIYTRNTLNFSIARCGDAPFAARDIFVICQGSLELTESCIKKLFLECAGRTSVLEALRGEQKKVLDGTASDAYKAFFRPLREHLLHHQLPAVPLSAFRRRYSRVTKTSSCVARKWILGHTLARWCM